MVSWWMALAKMPVGEATALVYCGPLFTALFGWILLGERPQRSFYGCLVLNLGGVLLVTQPSFIFGGSKGEHSTSYIQGCLFALCGAIVAGLSPSCVRLSVECHWSLVEHVTALSSMILLTPAGLLVWLLVLDAEVDLPSTEAYVMVLAVASVEFIGLGLQTYGYQKEEAARASLMT